MTPGGGGGYVQTLPIRGCAAQRGRDFEAPDLERGIHFRSSLLSLGRDATTGNASAVRRLQYTYSTPAIY